MMVSPRQLADGILQNHRRRNRHRYRQFFWLQAIADEFSRKSEDNFYQDFNAMTDDDGRARTFVNGSVVADAVTYEPVSIAKSLLTGKRTGNFQF
jgi:hypothetical protein